MIAICPAVPTGPGFLAGLLQSLDCHAVKTAEQTFAFVGHAGGPAAVLIPAALTLLIAIFGFRFMFGPGPTFGDATAAAVRVGVVLALATSWPAVTSVIARPVLQGPAELTATGAGATLGERLGRLDNGIAAMTSWGTGRNDVRAPRTASGDYAANAAATIPVADAIAFGAARVSYLLTAIAAVGIIKLLAGVLIGLAPLFAGLLLFDRTRGMFAGWARTLFALLIAGAAVRVALGLELQILEPWIGEVVRQRQALIAAPSAAVELLAITLAFGLICAGLIFVILRLCLSIEIGSVQAVMPDLGHAGAAKVGQETGRPAVTAVALPLRSERALQIAGGLERIEQFRSNTRLIDGRQATASSMSPGGPSGAGSTFPRTNPRRSRRTLIAQRRDAGT